MNTIRYEYDFEFTKGRKRKENFVLELNADTMEPVEPLSLIVPEWTKLEYHQCEGCPLDRKEYTHCPMAGQLAPLVEKMRDVLSIDEVRVTVTQDERAIIRHASAQEGISSIIGILNATCGCPLTAFFKPMARFHLPFSNLEETFYRVASMYMLGQYYRWQSGLSADLEMMGLQKYYRAVSKVNKGMAERIRSNARHDGMINALILLDMYVKNVPDGIDALLADIKPLFNPYLADIQLAV